MKFRESLKILKNNYVFWISSIFIIGIVIWGAVLPKQFKKQAEAAFSFTVDAFGWLYMFAVFFLIVFGLFLAVSRYGDIKLGDNDSEPKYSFFTWIGMLFSAGFGVGLVFFGVAEPMQHFLKPPRDEIVSMSPGAARTAMQYSFFHWGISQWAVFATVGLALAYFQFRKKKPALISTFMDPVFGVRKYPAVRTAIDILAVIATAIGVATSLGLGVLQVNGGLKEVFGMPENMFIQLTIMGVLLAMYLTSTTTGLSKGIRYLSIGNLSIAGLLMLLFLFIGPTFFILKVFALGVGDYMQQFFHMSFNFKPYQGEIKWLSEWTLFYWAWAIAWSPYVGSFVARVSRGRTIREYVFAVMFIPPAIALLWMAIFGGTALHLDLIQGQNIAQAVEGNIPGALFKTISNFPMSMAISIVTILLIFTFLTTSADSATYVLAMMTSHGKLTPSNPIKIIWGILQAAIAIVLLSASGLKGLETASLVAAVPFTLILLLMCYSLYKALKGEFDSQGNMTKDK